jgi:hypothetical protein
MVIPFQLLGQYSSQYDESQAQAQPSGPALSARCVHLVLDAEVFAIESSKRQST